ncbi:hypothetical protein HanIR_Chr15g0775471 [Helianthus annuus]|nr:hypothetical protein HanIR_Chr15g0775471 [Helianthus annuus]
MRMLRNGTGCFRGRRSVGGPRGSPPWSRGGRRRRGSWRHGLHCWNKCHELMDSLVSCRIWVLL